MNIDKPVMFLGNKIFDDRGSVGFVNDFDFKGVKRFYLVQNHEAGFIRAFHGHKKEGKYVTVVSGTAIIKIMPIAAWEHAPTDDLIQTFVISAEKPQVLWIPPGYFNGFKTMTLDTKVMFFSTATVEESKGDDQRIQYYPHMWERNCR